MYNMMLEHYVVGMVQTNCYFVINKETKELLVVDPGGSGGKLAEFAGKKDYRPKAILLTHGHFDHTGGIRDFLDSFPELTIPVYAHINEKETLEDPQLNLSAVMISGHGKSYHADVFVRDHEKLSLAGFTIEVLHTPGHTPGGCCYYFSEEKALFSGDSLFAGSIGRTDFPGGSMNQLVRSVKKQCLTLPEDTEVFPGHEGISTIGEEKQWNMFLQ